MADEEKKPERLMVKGQTAEDIAALYEKITGKKADLEKIRKRLAAQGKVGE